MLKIQSFTFNPLQVNTYVLYDETLEAIIVDPGNSCLAEDERLSSFISQERLCVRYIVNTHPHSDHIYGNYYCHKKYPEAEILLHKAGFEIYSQSSLYCNAFGFQQVEEPMPTLIDECREINFGHQQLQVIYTPGHCDGSICLLDKINPIVFTGDLLFKGSIGRSDLPSGNHQILRESLAKLFLLIDHATIYPGHGETSTLLEEKQENPFLRFLK